MKIAKRDIATRLPKLNRAKDFIDWRRRVETYIQQQDIDFLGLQDALVDGSASQNRKRLKANVKVKLTITLTLADGPLAQIFLIVDDNIKFTKVLWH